MTYEIKYEPDTVEGTDYPKYNIVYSGGPADGLKEFHSIDGVNGKVRPGYTLLNAPNWYGLEQTLRYSPLFGKAFASSSDKGFSLFMTTILNGKRGEASENALSFAFSMLGVEWTDSEKETLNEILTSKNFTIQL